MDRPFLLLLPQIPPCPQHHYTGPVIHAHVHTVIKHNSISKCEPDLVLKDVLQGHHNTLTGLLGHLELCTLCGRGRRNLEMHVCVYIPKSSPTANLQRIEEALQRL